MTRNLCSSCQEKGNKNGCTIIIGQAQCPNPKCGCVRSNLGCDNRVSCVLCAHVTPKPPAGFYNLPKEVQELVIELVTTTGDLSRPFLSISHVDDSGKDFDFERLRNAQGHDISLTAIDNTRVVLTNGPFESLTLTFSTEDLEAYRGVRMAGRRVRPVETRKAPKHFPVALADVIDKLTAHGFRFTGDSTTSLIDGEKHSGIHATVSFC